LAIKEKVLGPDHASTGMGLNNLACLYANQARYDEAEKFFRQALAIREKQLGPDHPHTKITRDGLAATLQAKGIQSTAKRPPSK
jgi:tetratricopeptide (TPR) repeat protein